MRALGVAMFTVLTLIAAVHVYWGLGFIWPFPSERALVDAVLGDPRATRIPPMALTGVVAAALWAAGFAALRASGAMLFGWGLLARVACGLLTLIFVARGISGVALGLGVLDYAVTPIFRTLDLWLYGPLCLLLGLGFGILTINGARSDA